MRPHASVQAASLRGIVTLSCCVVLCQGQLEHHTHQGAHKHAHVPGASRHDTHVDAVLQSYFNNTELAVHLAGIAERCGGLARLASIGRSARGAELWVLEMGERLGEPGPRPAVKYIGNMHGDEPTGRQLLLALAEWLCAHHSHDERAARLLGALRLSLLPSLNPDGFAARTRENAAGVDLNRDFPDPIVRGPGGLAKPVGTEQPETLAVMDWVRGDHFVAGANLHEGALVANYPWDGTPDHATRYAAAPDDAAFRHLASVYARHHTTMAASQHFRGGITNGAAWYPLQGGMQDWSYVAADCMELTLELNEAKWPPPGALPGLFHANLPALLAFPLAAALGGLRGTVRAAPGGADPATATLPWARAGRPLPAAIVVDGIDHATAASTEFGDFYRPLAPGTYRVTASLRGYAPAFANITVPPDGSGATANFLLEELPVAVPGISAAASAAGAPPATMSVNAAAAAAEAKGAAAAGGAAVMTAAPAVAALRPTGAAAGRPYGPYDGPAGTQAGALRHGYAALVLAALVTLALALALLQAGRIIIRRLRRDMGGVSPRLAGAR